ncbi:OmpA/MotB family protein [Sphingomonas sp. MMS24-JH45]
MRRCACRAPPRRRRRPCRRSRPRRCARSWPPRSSAARWWWRRMRRRSACARRSARCSSLVPRSWRRAAPTCRRIGKAVQTQPGSVTVEGHADSDQIASLTFPDNTALSQARADTVANIIRGELTDPARVTSKGMGDTVPLASNDTAEGKAKNRRVEVIVPRRD